MSFKTGIIATIIVFSTLSILAVYDFQMANTVEKTEMEVFEDNMEGMLEKMQKNVMNLVVQVILNQKKCNLRGMVV